MGGGTVLCFFSGKTDQEMAVFWSKTEILGQFCVFFVFVRRLVLMGLDVFCHS